MLRFTKMNGAGNDFVLIDNRSGDVRLTPEQIARICDRHRGIGADGILLLEKSRNGADFRMRYYNADGGEAEMCGNGARCFARFAHKVAGAGEKISFETPAGVIGAKLHGDLVTLTMSEPSDLRRNVPLAINGEEAVVHCINTGVPHVVVPVARVDMVHVNTQGAAIRRHKMFSPKGTNVNFWRNAAQNESPFEPTNAASRMRRSLAGPGSWPARSSLPRPKTSAVPSACSCAVETNWRSALQKLTRNSKTSH